MDVKIFYFFNNLVGKYVIFDTIVIFFADYLQYVLMIIFLSLLYFWSYKRQQKLQIFLITAISMIIARLGFVNLIRFIYPRPRPFIIHQVNQLIPEGINGFPSGHAALFFAMAIAIYFYNKKWGAWFFAAVVLMALARVTAGVHYPLDILAGAIIGVFSAYLVFYFAKKYDPSD